MHVVKTNNTLTRAGLRPAAHLNQHDSLHVRIPKQTATPKPRATKRLRRPQVMRSSATLSAPAAAGTIATTAAPPPYGWLMLSVAFTAVALQFMVINVAKARKEAGVEYPAMVADPATVGDAPAAKFNCAQRGHQNTLENLPIFLVMQLLIAQVMPLTAAALGAVWTIGRIIYVVGYTNGGPKKRLPGFIISNLAQTAMIFVVAWVGYSLLRA